MKYEITVDAFNNWAVCEEGAGNIIADLMTKDNAKKICDLLNQRQENF